MRMSSFCSSTRIMVIQRHQAYGAIKSKIRSDQIHHETSCAEITLVLTYSMTRVETWCLSALYVYALERVYARITLSLYRDLEHAFYWTTGSTVGNVGLYVSTVARAEVCGYNIA